MRCSRFFFICIALTALLEWGCTGCPTNNAPQQTLGFTQSWPNLPPASADTLVTELKNGTRTLNDPALAQVLRANQCGVFDDFSASPSPQLNANGTPGTPGFVAQIVSSNFVRLGGNCSQGSGMVPSPSQLTIEPDQGITIGQTTHTGTATFIIGSDTFTTATGYFEFTLSSFDTSSRVASGNFQAVAFNSTNRRDTRVYVVSGGSFLLKLPQH